MGNTPFIFIYTIGGSSFWELLLATFLRTLLWLWRLKIPIIQNAPCLSTVMALTFFEGWILTKWRSISDSLSDILFDVFSDILSGILSDIHYDTLFDIHSDFLSDSFCWRSISKIISDIFKLHSICHTLWHFIFTYYGIYYDILLQHPPAAGPNMGEVTWLDLQWKHLTHGFLDVGRVQSIWVTIKCSLTLINYIKL